MFKNNWLDLGGLLATMVLVGACGGDIGDSVGEVRGGPELGDFDGGVERTPEVEAEFAELRYRYRRRTSTTVEPAPTNALPPACSSETADVSASNGWRSTQAPQAAFDTLRFEFMARPAVADLNGLVAVGAENIDEFTDAAMSVRFAGSGVIDARNGAGYDSDILFTYDPATWYSIVISADIVARTYDVEVGRCGEPRQALITGAAFRSDWPVSDRLTTWAVWSSQSAGLELSTPAWVASGSCAPTTCQSLGAECGEPSDGCGGSLNCGGCASGQTCASGSVCVDVSAPPPANDCIPDTCQSLGVECGGASDGCGGGLNCGGCASGQTCASGGVCVNVSTPPPPPPGDARGRGPTGQWPAGFPAYTGAAEIITNGTSAGLSAAISNAACSDGCVIEHAGAPSGTFSARASGTGGIVVRPPIGQRGDYTLGSTTIRVDGLLFAGYAGGTGQLLVQGNGLSGKGSGFAWLDMGSTDGGRLVVYCNASSENSYGFFYEIVIRHYGSQSDRGGVRGYNGGDCKFEMVGSQITGDNGPITGHPDTIQDYNPSPGTSTIGIRDSILGSSTDKVIQGEWPGGNPFTIDNSMLIGPNDSEALWTGESLSFNDANVCVNAIATITNSTTLGKFNGPYVSIGASEIWGTSSGYTDLGGNTRPSTKPQPPAYPTATQLDAIWSP
jgi:hypothetical protein